MKEWRGPRSEQGYRIAVMVEGRLSEERLHQLQQHVLTQLAMLHATPWKLVESDAST